MTNLSDSNKISKAIADRFLDEVAAAIEIPDSQRESAIKKYESVGEWLQRSESSIQQYNPTIYPQGSFRLGTVIKPHNDEDDYDIDLVCLVDREKVNTSQELLKKMVGVEICSYASAQSMNNEPEDGRRCWTLVYAESARFHLDVLPAIPDAAGFRSLLESRSFGPGDFDEYALAITDKQDSNFRCISLQWPGSNPKGYAEWFQHEMEEAYNNQRMIVAESMGLANVEDVPDHRIKTTLQKAIQILKRHRDLMFSDNVDDKPISIIITTLATHAYNKSPSLSEALMGILEGMPNYIEDRNGVKWVQNPVDPTENFADKWPEHPERENNFYVWLAKARVDFEEALSASNPTEMGFLLAEKVGGRAANKAVNAFTSPNTGLLASAAGAVRNIFSVGHAKLPDFKVDPVPSYVTKINCSFDVDGFRSQPYTSGEFPLPKGAGLDFEVATNIPGDYKVHWQVVNTGYEASNCLRGGYLKNRGKKHTETTSYKGRHWVQAYVIKDDKCVSISDKFVVDIGDNYKYLGRR